MAFPVYLIGTGADALFHIETHFLAADGARPDVPDNYV
jgi:hypothetical protein